MLAMEVSALNSRGNCSCSSVSPDPTKRQNHSLNIETTEEMLPKCVTGKDSFSYHKDSKKMINLDL